MVIMPYAKELSRINSTLDDFEKENISMIGTQRGCRVAKDNID
jgi:hypothetical protein